MDERSRLLAAKADGVEHKLAEVREQYVSAAEVETEWSDIAKTIRSGLSAIPQRIGAKLPHLSAGDLAVADQIVRGILEEALDEPAPTDAEGRR